MERTLLGRDPPPRIPVSRSLVVGQIREHLQDPVNEQGFGPHRERLGRAGMIRINYMYWSQFGEGMVLLNTFSKISMRW
jgi:hypothetical protein